MEHVVDISKQKRKKSITNNAMFLQGNSALNIKDGTGLYSEKQNK